MKPILPVTLLLLIFPLACQAQVVRSDDGYRWFQVEVSIFSNDYPEYRDAEHWSADRLRLQYPARIREFSRIADFLQLTEERFDALVLGRVEIEADETPAPDSAARRRQQDLEYLARVGPFPWTEPANLRLPDLERDPYLLLPAGLSDFQTTNTRLERSPDNRLLWHGLWRQPVRHTDQASALLIRGGQSYGDHHELEGSITIRFNENEDRVVIDANLWLAEFTRLPLEESDWSLPPPPLSAAESGADESYSINRIVQMNQTREMRSNEFHYLDHPALGLVITVMPYRVPPQVSAAPESAGDAAADVEEPSLPQG